MPLGEGASVAEPKSSEIGLCGGLDRSEVVPHWLARIAATAPGVIYSFRRRPDGSTSFPYASPAMLLVAGVHPRDLAIDGMTGLSLVHPEDASRVLASIDKSARELTPWHVEFRINNPLRGEVWLEGHSLPQREADGSVFWYGFLTDVTDRKKAEARLRDSEGRFRLLFESSPVAIVDEDLSAVKARLDELGLRTGRQLRRHLDTHPDEVSRLASLVQIVDVNMEALRFLGCGTKDALCRHLPVYLVDESHALFAANLVAMLDGATTSEHETTLRTMQGVDRTVLVKVRTAPGHEESLSRVFVSLVDLTERREAEEALRQSETMSALGALVAGVAHEVRNPLFSISATLDALVARSRHIEDSGSHISILRAEVERMRALMDDLLDYGRPSVLERAIVPLSEVLTLSARTCEALAVRRRVALRITVREDVPPLVMDVGRITQVFRNLIENALHHAPAGSVVEVSARQNGRWVECLVEDSGPGFRREDLRAVFQPFFSRRNGGTGLGLPIVLRLVTQHGGRVLASNRPAGGARITVSLPLPGEVAAAS